MTVATEWERIAEQLVRDIDTVLAGCGLTPCPRPIRLADELGLDKSLASRVVRSLRAANALDSLATLPSPEGLTLVLQGAAKAGCPKPLIERARQAVRVYEELLATYPGGRGGFETALADLVPASRERNELRSRQAVYRAMQYLMGVHLDVSYNVHIYAPAEDPNRIDLAWIAMRHGFRRLRSGSKSQLVAISRDPQGRDAAVSAQTLGRMPIHQAEDCLLREYCSPSLPALAVHELDDGFIVAVGEADPPVNVPITLTAGQLLTALVPRYATADRQYEYSAVIPGKPTGLLIVDTFVHSDLFTGTPVITSQMEGSLAPPMSAPRAAEYDECLQSVRLELVGSPWDAASAPEAPRRNALLADAFGQLGWKREAFRLVRFAIKYPLVSAKIRLWFRLPEAVVR